MKKINLLTAFALFNLASSLSSCQASMSIFDAGVGFGILIVVTVGIAIAITASRLGRKKIAPQEKTLKKQSKLFQNKVQTII